MGPPIFGVALTTVTVAFIMLFCKVICFVKFAQMLIVTILCSLVGAFVSYAVLGPAEPTRSTYWAQDSDIFQRGQVGLEIIIHLVRKTSNTNPRISRRHGYLIVQSKLVQLEESLAWSENFFTIIVFLFFCECNFQIESLGLNTWNLFNYIYQIITTHKVKNIMSKGITYGWKMRAQMPKYKLEYRIR